MTSNLEQQNNTEAVRKLLLTLARVLVDEPDSVRVGYRSDLDVIVYTLEVGAEEVGKLIGKGGRTAKALRTIVSGVASKLNLPLRLEISEPARLPGASSDRLEDA